MTRPPQKIVLRKATALDWVTVNPVLQYGELALETDTRKLKAGDGTTAWADLLYITLGDGSFDGTLASLVDTDLSGLADRSLLWWNGAQQRWIADNNITVLGIVDGGNF